MRRVLCALVFLIAALPLPAGPNDFDYLLGDWSFTAVSKQWGKFQGVWSAVKVSDGVVLDEYRIVGDDGETIYVTTTLRSFNKTQDQWELVGTHAGSGLQNSGTGKRAGNEVRIEQKFGFGTEEPSIWRIRYHDIQADRFLWTADRSTDGGKTWTKNFQTIEARRIGPPRTFGPIAKPIASPPPASQSRTDVVQLAAERLDRVRHRLILQNGYNGPVGYNLCASGLQRWSDSGWQPVETGEMCTMELRSLPPGQDATFEKRLPDGLAAGRHRYVTSVEIPMGTEQVEVTTAPFDVK